MLAVFLLVTLYAALIGLLLFEAIDRLVDWWRGRRSGW
jgi:hypothetical protein